MNLVLVFGVALSAWCGLIALSNWYDDQRWRHAIDRFEAPEAHEYICQNYAALAASSRADQSRVIWVKEIESEECEN